MDASSPWKSEDGSIVLGADAVQTENTALGAELAMLQMSKF